MLAEEIRKRLKLLKPIKNLGQHFLINEKFLEREVQEADLKPTDVVLEVGPGFGFLTAKLATRCRVVAVEKDRRFEQFLTGLSNAEIIWGDVLEAPVPKFTKVVSNLPYRISSSFTFWLLEKKFESAILTYQEEFAQRMVKTNNRLGMSLAFLADVKLLQKVPASWFLPPPKVNSTLVKLTPKSRPENWQEIAKLLQKLYQQPKKTVKNALRSLNAEIPKKMAEKRVRELSKEDILAINSYVKV